MKSSQSMSAVVGTAAEKRAAANEEVAETNRRIQKALADQLATTQNSLKYLKAMRNNPNMQQYFANLNNLEKELAQKLASEKQKVDIKKLEPVTKNSIQESGSSGLESAIMDNLNRIESEVGSIVHDIATTSTGTSFIHSNNSNKPLNLYSHRHQKSPSQTGKATTGSTSRFSFAKDSALSAMGFGGGSGHSSTGVKNCHTQNHTQPHQTFSEDYHDRRSEFGRSPLPPPTQQHLTSPDYSASNLGFALDEDDRPPIFVPNAANHHHSQQQQQQQQEQKQHHLMSQSKSLDFA